MSEIFIQIPDIARRHPVEQGEFISRNVVIKNIKVEHAVFSVELAIIGGWVIL